MRLPEFLNPVIEFFEKKKSVQDGYYLGLFLKEEEGIALYIEKHGASLKVKTFEKFSYSNGWDNLTEDLDAVLTRLESETQKSPDEVILFVYSYLIDEESKQIKKPYIDKIKVFIKNLDLKPLGYIDAHEAVVAGLERREDMPLTAILIELDKTNLEIFIYKGGKQVFKKHIIRSQSMLEDLLPPLEGIRQEFVLPSRIVLYDSGKLDVEAGKILTHKFRDDFFIQLPKVEIIRQDDLINDLLDIFASQLSNENKSLPEASPEVPQEKPKDVLGFVIGGEVQDKVEEKEEVDDVQPHEASPILHEAQPVTAKKIITISSLVSQARTWFTSVLVRIRKVPFPVLPVVGVALIILAVFLTEYYFHTAAVTINLPSQAINSNVTLLASDKKASDADLIVTSSDKQTDFSDQIATTGKREEGKKATGDVTLHNFSDEEKTFSKSSTLTAQDHAFILLDEVKVASSSLSQDGSAKLPGKKSGKVEAKEIGSDYNIGKGARFSIDDLSSSTYFGINDESFSGGSKQDIRTIAKADLDRLKANVLKKADAYISSNIKPKLPKGVVMLDKLTTKDVDSFTPSGEVGQEATQVKVDAKVTIGYVSYKDQDLKKSLAATLDKKVDSDLAVDPVKVSYTIKDIKKNKNDYSISVSARAKAAEALKKEDLSKLFAGKKAESIAEVAKDKYKATSVEYEVHDPLPFLNGWLPFFAKNIQVTIRYP